MPDADISGTGITMLATVLANFESSSKKSSGFGLFDSVLVPAVCDVALLGCIDS